MKTDIIVRFSGISVAILLAFANICLASGYVRQDLQTSAQWGENQNNIAVFLSDKEIIILSSEGEKLYSLKASEPIGEPALSPRGGYFAYIQQSRGLILYSVADKTTALIFPVVDGRRTSINNVQWSHDGGKLLFKVLDNPGEELPGSAKYYVYDVASKHTRLLLEIKSN